MTDNFLHTMYQSEEEVEEKPISDAMPDRGIMNMPAMSSAIRRMEQMIIDLAKTVENQKRAIRQQEQRFRHLVNTQRGFAGDLKDMQHGLDNKISMRDDF